MPELVSVIIPTFGMPDALCRAIDSVRKQDYENIEILVVDDNDPCSEERIYTEQRMKAYDQDRRVLYIRHERNMERSVARNTGIQASKGKYLMFLDNDDVYLPGKISYSIKRIEELDSSYAAVYTAYRQIRKGKTIYCCAEKREGMLLIPCICRDLHVHTGSNLLVKKCVAEEIGGFNPSLSANEDILFLAKILERYKLGYANMVGLEVNIKETYRKDLAIASKAYVEQIKRIVSGMNAKTQKLVMDNINIQVARYFLLKEKNPRKAIHIIKKEGICLSFTIRYASYCTKRFITKKVFGYVTPV